MYFLKLERSYSELLTQAWSLLQEELQTSEADAADATPPAVVPPVAPPAPPSTGKAGQKGKSRKAPTDGGGGGGNKRQKTDYDIQFDKAVVLKKEYTDAVSRSGRLELAIGKDEEWKWARGEEFLGVLVALRNALETKASGASQAFLLVETKDFKTDVGKEQQHKILTEFNGLSDEVTALAKHRQKLVNLNKIYKK